MVKFRPWYLLLPSVGLLAFIDLVPFFYALYLSFTRYFYVRPEPPLFNGFENYEFMVNHEEFLSSLWRGALFTSTCVIVQLLAGLFTAFILYRRFKGGTIFKVILTLPLAVAPVTVGSMWRLMFYPGIGPIPYYLNEFLGLEWDMTANSTTAFLTTILMDTWHWLPFAALILLSGLVAVPHEILEISELDGASYPQKLRYIFLPLMKFEIALVVLLRGMDAFRIFDEVWMLTAGGPGGATRYLSISLYTLILKAWDMGYGAAVSIIFLYLIIVLCWLLYKAVTRVGE